MKKKAAILSLTCQVCVLVDENWKGRGERIFVVVYNSVSTSMCDRNEVKLYFMYGKVCFVFMSRYWIAVKRNAKVWCGN